MNEQPQFEKTLLHENEVRKLIKVIDRKNNRVKYVKEYSDGSREDSAAPYPPSADQSIWQPYDRNLCVKVKWVACQSAEDVYQRMDDPNRFLIRQPAADKDSVCWHTAVSWSGGYEADCHLRSGILIHAVTDKGTVLFTEQPIYDEDSGELVAKKRGPFSYEAVRDFADGIKQWFHLISFDDWKKWLLAYKKDENKENDTWLFYDTELREQALKILPFAYLGKKCCLIREKLRHKASGCEWDAYSIVSEDGTETVAVCVFEIIKQGELNG